ncbi:hypothetical protein HAX54_011147, partial [Datura stramonium]|nr:hypothetical protein [Datura stramonium]
RYRYVETSCTAVDTWHINREDGALRPFEGEGCIEEGGNKRKADFDNKYSEGRGSGRAGPSWPSSPLKQMDAKMAAMRELVRGFHRLPGDGASSSATKAVTEALQGAIAPLSQAHIDIQEHLEAKKSK